MSKAKPLFSRLVARVARLKFEILWLFLDVFGVDCPRLPGCDSECSCRVARWMTCSPSLFFRFPLYNKGKEKIQFYYGTFLLNKNIAQVKFLTNSHSLQQFLLTVERKLSGISLVLI